VFSWFDRTRRTSTGRILALISGLVAVAVSSAMPAAAARLRQLSEFAVTRVYGYALDDAGSQLFFVSDADPLGTNPDSVRQLFLKTLPGGALQQLTTLPEHKPSDPGESAWIPTLPPGPAGVTASDNGSHVAFLSASDPLGTNPDESIELFLYDVGGMGLTQLTDHPARSGEVRLAALSGSANRVAFVSDGDLTGENPAGVVQLFVIDSNGSNLAQLTATTLSGSISSLSISDDGQRLAFADDRDLTGGNPDGSVELFRVIADGSGLEQATFDAYVEGLALAGPGNRIAYVSSGSLYWVDWGSQVSTWLADGASAPSIVDNGRDVYYQYGGIRKVNTISGVQTDVWTTAEAWAPVIAGGGSRLAFWLAGRGVPFVSEPDAAELVVTDGSGLLPEQAVELAEDGIVMPFEMTADGRWIVFSWGHLTSIFDRMDLFLCDTVTGAVTPVTDRAWSVNPTISDDGGTITFSSYRDSVTEPCGSRKIYRVAADGTNLQQIVPALPCTAPATFARQPSISGDGTTVVVQASGNPAGTDTGGGAELYGVAPTGGPVWQIINDDDGEPQKKPRVDGSGTWVVYQSLSNVTGQNPPGGSYFQVFRARVDGTYLEQLTFGSQESQLPDITANGNVIVYGSAEDPLGTNPSNDWQIFVHDTTAGTTEQLTTAGGHSPRVSPNGAYVVFNRGGQLYRIDRATGEAPLASAGIYTHSWIDTRLGYDVDNDGNVAFYGDGNLVGRNPDASWELWLAEFDVDPRFDVGAGAPTVLGWDPLPWAERYDVIRGDLADLAPGPAGTIDLGDVVCIENDSNDARTAGDEDVAQPSVGQGFFYLYRPDADEQGNPGSWGHGGGGAERLVSSGDCAIP